MSFNNPITFYYQGKSILYNHNISISRRSKVTLNDNLISTYEEVNKTEALLLEQLSSFLILIVPIKKLASLIQGKRSICFSNVKQIINGSRFLHLLKQQCQNMPIFAGVSAGVIRRACQVRLLCKHWPQCISLLFGSSVHTETNRAGGKRKCHNE